MGSSEFRWQELKRRKIVQWALAYLAGAWLLAEVAGHLADTWSLPAALIQGLHVVLAAGLVAALVLAWYHGEQGRQRVSGPELLMLAGIFLTAGVVVAALGGDTASEAAEPRLPETAVDGNLLDAESVSPRSIAVLPLENHSSDGEYTYFADAMSAEISTALMSVPALDVKSYESAGRFEDSALTATEFAAELGVAHLLAGSVQRDGARIRITVRLMEARTGEQLWTRVYDEVDVIEAIDVQVDIARQVAEQLAAEFSERERDRLTAGMTDDPLAYDAYLQAARYDRTVPEELDLAIERLRYALRRDSTYAAAWASLGGSYDWKLRVTGEARWRDSTLQTFRRAATHARGTPLESNLQAAVALLEGRLEDAISLMREGALANPGSALATRDFAFTLQLAGRFDEAVRWMRRSIDFDPLDPFGWAALGLMHSELGLDAAAVGAFEQAAERADRGGEYDWLPFAWYFEHGMRVGDTTLARVMADSVLARRGGEARWVEGLLAVRTGNLERARLALSSSTAPEPRVLPYLAYVQVQLGDSVAADRALEAARGRAIPVIEPLRGYPELIIAAVADNPEEVVRALADYVDEGGRDARSIRRDPVFDRVRYHPAFVAELERLEEIVVRQRRQVERQLAGGE